MLNRAVMHAEGDYLIFTEDNCIPRFDFVKNHKNKATPNHFLSGGHSKLPMCCSLQIGQEEILSNDAFDIMWLQSHGYPTYAKKLRLIARWPFNALSILSQPKTDGMDTMPRAGKVNITGVNGFDERILDGGEDKEIGDRLKNSGVRVKRIRYSAVCVHLSHIFGFDDSVITEATRQSRNETKSMFSKYTDHGILKS